MEELLDFLKFSIENNHFVKLTLSKPKRKSIDLKNVFIKPVQIKNEIKLNFVFRYPTQDITKNFDIDESLNQIKTILTENLSQADLFTSESNWFLKMSKKGKIHITKQVNTQSKKPDLEHNKSKKKHISIENNIYLQELGITSSNNLIKKDKHAKYRQINKYIEIIEGIIRNADLPKQFHITDMGSGKGYLTFALYDYLVNDMNLSPDMLGVELRDNLVHTCNDIAKKADFKNLKFQKGKIETAPLPDTDMLIALHACDTATDEAIYRGIQANSKIIICAPCCHKQIRKELDPKDDFKEIIKFGILKERQAELITDGIRALILEAHGYKTKVFEFISTEHTPKNVLIVGVRKKEFKEVDQDILKQVAAIKLQYGIKKHHLEGLLGL